MDSCAVALMSGSELLCAYDAVHEQVAELGALGTEILARLDGTGHAKMLGAHDTARLLADRYRLDPTEATRRVKLATALPKYAVVAAALPTPGSTTPEGGVVLHLDQAQAIVSALEQIPKRAHVPAEDLAAAEERMVEAARHLAPGDLRKLGAQIRDLLDTDGPEPREEAARAAEEVWLQRIDGGVKFGGRLAAENAELLQLTLEYGAKPHKTETGELDQRSRGKRYADALVDALRIAAGTGDLPTRGGIKPHITVTIDLDDLINTGRHATGDPMFGDGLSASAIRRLACDAGIIPIVLGSDSQVLDVGREHRFVTGGLRNALIQRDRGCVVCHAPPIYCDAHHLASWADGGITSLANLVLMCRVHHTALHDGHWTITIIDNQVHVTRPTWTDPPPHDHHRKLTPPNPTAPAPTTAPATTPCPATNADAPATTPDTSTAPFASTTGTIAARHWPYTDDIPWITPEEAAALDPWGDNTSATSIHPSAATTPAPNPTRSTAADTADTADTDPPSTPAASLFDPWADSA